MNRFLCINDRGGYIGRFYWLNSGAIDHEDWPYWGTAAWLPTTIASAWAGSIWVLRVLLKH